MVPRCLAGSARRREQTATKWEAGMERIDDAVNIESLCDAIIDRYHSAVQEMVSQILGSLEAMRTGAGSPELELVRIAFDDIAEQIEHHLAKEQHLLFPAFAALSEADRRSGRRPTTAFATVLYPIRLMEAEHARIELALDRLRELARAVREPDGPPPTWGRCLADLAKLDAELRQHHRSENEVLFPRALELEQRLL